MLLLDATGCCFEQLLTLSNDSSLPADLEKQFSILREQLYHERINQVDQEITEIRNGKSKEYLGPLQRLSDNMHTRIEVAGVLRRLRMENILHKYDSEEQAARQNYEVIHCLSYLLVILKWLLFFFVERKATVEGHDLRWVNR